MTGRVTGPCDTPSSDHDGEVRFYVTGWKCDAHSPWALRGLSRPAPGPGAIYSYRPTTGTDHENGPTP